MLHFGTHRQHQPLGALNLHLARVVAPDVLCFSLLVQDKGDGAHDRVHVGGFWAVQQASPAHHDAVPQECCVASQSQDLIRGQVDEELCHLQDEGTYTSYWFSYTAHLRRLELVHHTVSDSQKFKFARQRSEAVFTLQPRTDKACL